VYIIRTVSGTLYTGITTDIDRRLREHMDGKRGAKFFRTSRPMTLVYKERHRSRSQAAAREAEIKQMDRQAKLELIRKRTIKSLNRVLE